MSSEVSIQTLFSQLRLEHMLAYLRAKGWNEISEVAGGRVRYELENDSAPYVLILPRSNKSSQASRMLQAAIYTLCEVEDGQPRDIIFEMFAMEPLKAPPVEADQTGVRLRLANNDLGASLTLQISSRPGETLLMPGEAVEIVVKAPPGELVDISVKKVDS